MIVISKMTMVSNTMEMMKHPYVPLKDVRRLQPRKGGVDPVALEIAVTYVVKPRYDPVWRMNAHKHTTRTRRERFHSA